MCSGPEQFTPAIEDNVEAGGRLVLEEQGGVAREGLDPGVHQQGPEHRRLESSEQGQPDQNVQVAPRNPSSPLKRVASIFAQLQHIPPRKIQTDYPKLVQTQSSPPVPGSRPFRRR